MKTIAMTADPMSHAALEAEIRAHIDSKERWLIVGTRPEVLVLLAEIESGHYEDAAKLDLTVYVGLATEWGPGGFIAAAHKRQMGAANLSACIQQFCGEWLSPEELDTQDLIFGSRGGETAISPFGGVGMDMPLRLGAQHSEASAGKPQDPRASAAGMFSRYIAMQHLLLGVTI